MRYNSERYFSVDACAHRCAQHGLICPEATSTADVLAVAVTIPLNSRLFSRLGILVPAHSCYV